MNSVILQIAARYVRWMLLIFALVALIRGHNYPGGGFIGGLLAGLALIYDGFAFDHKRISKKRKINPVGYIGVGLLLIFISLLFGILSGDVLMKGIWISLNLPLLGQLKLGTPFIFDIGVFFVVIGITILFFLSLKRR
ncbi:MAG: Na(+)/H(+) antiporter subunit B [Bacteroidetes bacterium]|nr:Na(+)/H(+) antiporter subunit B [Bacteroidota bacterium]